RDLGCENFGLPNGHTLLRNWHDGGALISTLPYRWMNEKNNVMPEIGWSQLRHRWTPGFKDILTLESIMVGMTRVIDSKRSRVFRWIFMPWLQRELDAY
ncbi:hypothetical protein C8J57DRAFT_977345, partial [Mycena rebaudengoi]